MFDNILVNALKWDFKKNLYLIFFIVFIFCLFTCSLNALDNVNQYLLPKKHPLQNQLKTLFSDPEMFEDPQNLLRNGFWVFPRVHRQFMVIAHPSINNYLFKKFQNSIDSQDQLKNYITRVKGARTLAKFIATKKLRHVVVPQKWLYALPKRFNDKNTNETTYILIVEKLDICGGWTHPQGELAQRYLNISKDVLKELCLVLYNFRGLDSMIHNMPFTYQNQIAFIDTEKWQIKRKGYLSKAMPFLSKENQDFALSLFKEFERDE